MTDGGNVKVMTVMGEALVDGLSDAGSTPARSISEWKKLKNAVNRRFTAFFLSANLKGQDRYRYLFNFNIQCFQQTNDIGK